MRKGEMMKRIGNLSSKMNHRPKIILTADEIPNIIGATIHGLIEIGWGCGRGCSFCTPDTPRLRFKSVEHIARDAETNVKAGQRSISLHSEDVLRYCAKGIAPDDARVLNLIKSVASIEGIKDVGASHIALAALRRMR